MSASRGVSAGHGDELGARHHHLAGREIGEAEHAVEHLLLLLLEDAGLLARRHEHLQLFLPECTIARPSVPCMPEPLTTACAVPCSSRMNGHSTRMNTSVGATTHSAVASARSSAIHFGVSSPKTMWKAVMTVNAIATAMLCAVAAARCAGSARERAAR